MNMDVYIICIEIQTHACIYLRKIWYVYILNILIYNNVNIVCVSMSVCVLGVRACVCVFYMYIINQHRKHAYIM